MFRSQCRIDSNSCSQHKAWRRPISYVLSYLQTDTTESACSAETADTEIAKDDIINRKITIKFSQTGDFDLDFNDFDHLRFRDFVRFHRF